MSVSSNYIEEENSAYTSKIFTWLKLFFILTEMISEMLSKILTLKNKLVQK